MRPPPATLYPLLPLLLHLAQCTGTSRQSGQSAPVHARSHVHTAMHTPTKAIPACTHSHPLPCHAGGDHTNHNPQHMSCRAQQSPPEDTLSRGGSLPGRPPLLYTPNPHSQLRRSYQHHKDPARSCLTVRPSVSSCDEWQQPAPQRAIAATSSSCHYWPPHLASSPHPAWSVSL